ncbi:MAG: hypothetical protein ACD_75C01669G0002 [uncultured bacterium]|nr:MAG: hypothetical protein ACD_75C01669G0002 [uncultured bacterium]
MVGQTLKLQGDRPDNPGSGIDRETGEGFQRLAAAEIMTDTGVAGNPFAYHRQALERYSGQEFFDPAMLIAELDLQGKDLFAGTLKAEMAGFDDAGVNRPHRDLVDSLAFNLKVGVVAGNILVVIIAENIGRPAIVGMVTNHFQPGVVLRGNAVLFGNLPLEHMEARARRTSQRGKTLPHLGGQHIEVFVADDRQQFVFAGVGKGKKLDDEAVVFDKDVKDLGKARKGNAGQRRTWHGFAVLYLQEVIHESFLRLL